MSRTRVLRRIVVFGPLAAVALSLGLDPARGCAEPRAAEEAETGFVPLFNGEDLTGWEQINGSAEYGVEDGVIVGRTVEGSPNSFLCTTEHYDDFILLFQVKVDPRLNSGVQIRSQSTADYRNGRVHGYQVEIDPVDESGYIYDEARRGWLSQDRENQTERGVFTPDDWNSYVVICEGDRIQTFINGHPVADLTDDMTASGFIGLQVHSFRGDPPAEARWKNIYIKEF